MKKKVKYIEIILKNKERFIFDISSFQYFDYTVQETINKLSITEPEVYSTLMANYVSFLFRQNVFVFKDDVIKEDITAVDYLNEHRNICFFKLYDENKLLIYKLNVKKNFDLDNCRNLEFNKYQKNYLHKGCLGVNIKKNNNYNIHSELDE